MLRSMGEARYPTVFLTFQRLGAHPQGHGMHTAGTVGAAGDNGVGVTGVNWKVSGHCGPE